jgi:hypothetical protein
MPSLPTPGALDLWGAQLNAWLLVAHNADGTLKPQAAAVLSAILAAGNDAGGSKIINLGTPTNPAEAATKAYVDAAIAAGVTPDLASVLGVGNDAGATTIENLGAPVAETDAATKGYVDQVVLNVQTGTSYTFGLSDAGVMVDFTNTGAVTATIPTNAAVAFPIGTLIYVRAGVSAAAGGITIAPTLGVTLVNPYNSFALFGAAAEAKLTKIGTDAWSLNGEVV